MRPVTFFSLSKLIANRLQVQILDSMLSLTLSNNGAVGWCSPLLAGNRPHQLLKRIWLTSERVQSTRLSACMIVVCKILRRERLPTVDARIPDSSVLGIGVDVQVSLFRELQWTMIACKWLRICRDVLSNVPLRELQWAMRTLCGSVVALLVIVPD